MAVCGHGFGAQTPANVQMLVPVQVAWVVTVQTSFTAQQEPVGVVWQGFGAQDVPAPCQTLGDTHAASAETVHVPAGAQHAPVGVTGGVGSSFPQPKETITTITAKVTSLRMVRPPHLQP